MEEDEDVLESINLGAGDKGSDIPFRLRGISGGWDAVSIIELRFGKTGSIKGLRLSSGGLPLI